MAITLAQGGPCTNDIRMSEHSGSFDRKCSLSLLFALCQPVVFTVSWIALLLLSFAMVQLLSLCQMDLVGLFAAFPRFLYRPIIVRLAPCDASLSIKPGNSVSNPVLTSRGDLPSIYGCESSMSISQCSHSYPVGPCNMWLAVLFCVTRYFDCAELLTYETMPPGSRLGIALVQIFAAMLRGEYHSLLGEDFARILAITNLMHGETVSFGRAICKAGVRHNGRSTWRSKILEGHLNETHMACRSLKQRSLFGCE